MSDLGALKSLIAGKLQRSDLTSEIAYEIPRAIEFFADERFWFNEDIKTATTTAEDEYVAVPTGLRVEDMVQVTIGSQRYPLRKKSRNEIETMDGWSEGTTGQPVYYSYDDGEFRIYPEPNTTYTLTVPGIYDEAALSADDDSNAWTGVAQDLISARVQFVLARDELKDPDMMISAKQAMDEALAMLRLKTGRRQTTGRIKAHI